MCSTKNEEFEAYLASVVDRLEGLNRWLAEVMLGTGAVSDRVGKKDQPGTSHRESISHGGSNSSRLMHLEREVNDLRARLEAVEAKLAL